MGQHVGLVFVGCVARHYHIWVLVHSRLRNTWTSSMYYPAIGEEISSDLSTVGQCGVWY